MNADCLPWTGHIRPDGYGSIQVRGTNYRAHRLSYEAIRGDIPKGLFIDHLCRNRACVNPYHMELVTHRTNTIRGIGITAKNAKKTYCKRGHPLFGQNLRPYANHRSGRINRSCRECQKGYIG